jgi:single-stranded-DNA-specific exonuclease
VAVARRPEDIVRHILTERGIVTEDAIGEFFSDRPKRTYDPFLLPDMETGAELILSSLKAGRRVCVYGDYDADGVMSTVLLHRFLCALPDVRPDVLYYIPSRFDEGYGLNRTALSIIRERGAELVVTVDCGSVSKSEVAYAQSIGLSVVITDHHACDSLSLPDCAVINPKREDSAYPWRELSGCGVAFKLAQAIKRRYYAGDAAVAAALNASLDLTAVATIADVMPLSDENRTLVKYGLASLNRGERPALQKLASAIGLTPGKITAHNIAFGIAPHINAAGRMACATAAAELFLTEDAHEMDVITDELVRYNGARRALQDRLVDRCAEMTDRQYGNDKFLLLRPPDIHEGIAGVVAGRIKDRYGLPTAVLSESVREDEDDGLEPVASAGHTGVCASRILKGSVRSIPGVDVIAMLKRHGELFLKLGGHAMAAGFTLAAENEERLRTLLNGEMETLIAGSPALLKRDVAVDAEAEPDELSLELAVRIRAFEPTGQGNPKPRFRLACGRIDNVKRMGEQGQHLRFTADGVPCVLFGTAEKYADAIAKDRPLSLVGVLDVNDWNGREQAQFIVREVLVP